MVPRKLFVMQVTLLLGLLALLGLPAQSPDSINSSEENDTPELWFVELTNAPQADGTSAESLRQEKANFRNAARQAGVSYTERYAYDQLWNGFSVWIRPSELGKMSRVAGVMALYPVFSTAVPDAADPIEADLATALAMTGADIAQNTLGLTGAGVKVAVMDTGVDYHHADLGGCFGPGCRVVTGWDFVGDAFNADSSSPFFNPVPVPDPDPDDCNGHGTHVAGIAGANGAVTGVAPGVTFGAYRVFGCRGSTTADVMLAAMERVLADGMQVLNMSIGAAFQWPQYPTGQGSTRLVNKGVVVVASIGNNGTSGLYAAGAPGVGKKVIGVAAIDNTHVALTTFTITPDNLAIGYGAATAAPAPPLMGSQPMKRTGTSTSTADACSPLPAGSLTGHVALIRRGTCTFHAKSLHAQNAGAVGVVLYNNTAGRFSPTVAGSPPITIPVVAISDTEGVLINSRLAAGPVSMTWTSLFGSFPNPTGNLISSFSSYGTPPDLSLKPDLGAPGGLIRSTYPVELGAYATLSGTSMSSPHVAGAAALVLEARPNTPSQAMRTLLQNSADPRVWWGSPSSGFLDNVHRQGAGMADIPGSILSTVKVEPSKLELGESQFGPVTRTLTVSNEGTTDVTFDLSHQPALATGPNTFAVSFFNAPSTVAFSAPSVSVPAGGSATFDATISPNTGLADRSLYGGYLTLTPQGGGAFYRVPFAGIKGDYQAAPVLTPTPNNFPWLAKLIGANFFNQPGGAAYTLAGGDVPYVLLHLDHGVRRIRMEVFEAASGKAWHRALEIPYLARNSTATSFFSFSWDGTTTAGKKVYTVPNGQYVIKLSVQKALGEDNDPTHWETWTSPVVTLNRP